MSLRECWIKSLGKAHQKPTQSPLLAKATSYIQAFQSARSPYIAESLRAFFTGKGSFGLMLMIHIGWEEGRRYSKSFLINNLVFELQQSSLFQWDSMRFLFTCRNRLVCILEALAWNRSLLNLLSENMQDCLLRSLHIVSILEQPLLYSDLNTHPSQTQLPTSAGSDLLL